MINKIKLVVSNFPKAVTLNAHFSLLKPGFFDGLKNLVVNIFFEAIPLNKYFSLENKSTHVNSYFKLVQTKH